MLIRFDVENYKVFGDAQTFSMAAGRQRLKGNQTENIDGLSVLKLSAIYGPNGGGKTSFVSAIALLQRLATGYKLNLRDEESFCKFDEENRHKPTNFRIVFSVKNRIFSYSLSIILKKKEIVFEELKELILASETEDAERLIFQIRDGLLEIGHRASFSTKALSSIEVFFGDAKNKSDTTFLSYLVRLRNVEFIGDKGMMTVNLAYRFFRDLLTVISPDDHSIGAVFFDEKELKERCDILSAFGIGITNISEKPLSEEEVRSRYKEEIFDELKNRAEDIILNENATNPTKEKRSYRVFFYSRKCPTVQCSIDFSEDPAKVSYSTLVFSHGKDISFLDYEESDGTRRLFELSSVLTQKDRWYRRAKDVVFIVDELDRCFHPLLTIEFIKRFIEQDNEGAQLIVTTHESRLLDLRLLRQDQIWFVSSDHGKTQIYSLDQFHERFDKKIDRAYLDGRYGAVPLFVNPYKHGIE